MQSLGVQGSLARGPDNFKFEIWRVGLIEEESVGDGGREHMFNASHSFNSRFPGYSAFSQVR